MVYVSVLIVNGISQMIVRHSFDNYAINSLMSILNRFSNIPISWGAWQRCVYPVGVRRELVQKDKVLTGDACGAYSGRAQDTRG